MSMDAYEYSVNIPKKRGIFMKRLLSILLTVCMVAGLLPAQMLAADMEDAPQQFIDLPIITDGGVMMSEGGATGTMLTRDKHTMFVYQGADFFYFDAQAWLKDADGNNLTVRPEDNGILQMLDAEGNVLASSEAIGSYYSEWVVENDTGFYRYYIGNARFESDKLQDLSAIPAGTYSLQLFAGNTAYATDGKITVVSSDDLLLNSAYINGMFLGADSVDIHLSCFGFADESELGDLSFELLDEDGNVVGRSTARYRDFSVYDEYGVTTWNLFAELVLNDGCTLTEDVQYTLHIAYSGERTLYCGARFSSSAPYEPEATIDSVVITDAQTSEVTLSISNAIPSVEYTITATTSTNSNNEPQILHWKGTIPEDGKLTVNLNLNGSTVAMTQFGHSIEFRISWINSWNSETNNWFSLNNPYYNMSSGGSGNVHLTDYWLTSTTDSWTFSIYGHNSNLYLGGGDVAVLKDEDGNEVARCTEFTEVELTERSFEITGTFTFSPRLKADNWYTFVFNDVELDQLLAFSTMHSGFNTFFANWESKTFYTNMGIFPVEVEVVNSSGTGTITMRDASGKTVLSSGDLTGTTASNGFAKIYKHLFTAEDFEKLTHGGAYTLHFTDKNASYNEDVEDQNRDELGTYDATVVLPDYAAQKDVYLRPYESKEGDTVIPIEYYLSGGTICNVTQKDLEGVKAFRIVNTTDGTVYTVTGLDNGRWLYDSYYDFEIDMVLDKPLTAGDYEISLDGMTFEWFDIDESEEPGQPYINTSTTLDKGYLYGNWLPEDGVYTGQLYDGYTCLTKKPIPLTWVDLSGETYLAFDVEQLRALNLPDGTYELRIRWNGTLIGNAEIRFTSSDMPIVQIRDLYSDALTLSNNSGMYSIQVLNGGAFNRVRAAESPEDLAQSQYYSTVTAPIFTLSEGAGEKTVYVQLQSNDGTQESEVMTFKVWYTGGELLEVTVPDDVQGIYAGDIIEVELSAPNTYFAPVMEYETAYGQIETVPMYYVGEGQPTGLYPPAVHGLESEHPFVFVEDEDGYSYWYEKSWSYTEEGADSLRITFSPATTLRDDCRLYLYAGTGEDLEQIDYFYESSNDELAGKSFLIPGDSVTIQLETYRNSDPCYGFAVTKVEALTAAQAAAIVEDVLPGETPEVEVLPGEAPDADILPEAGSLYRYSTGLLEVSSGEYQSLQDCETVRFYLMDQNGRVVSETVERMLIFGNPDTVILPQFRDGDLYCTENSFTLYGYATPGSTVTVSEDDTVLAETTANTIGYFTVDIAELEDGLHWLIVADNSGITDATEAYLTVDTVAPVIKSINFTFSENNAATLRWECDDDDIDRFTILQNSRVLDEYVSSDARTYSVHASQDDGNFFTVRAVDYAGNVGELTVSTADQIPPTAPGTVTVSGVTTTSAYVTWSKGTDNIGVMGYVVYLDGEELTYLSGEDNLNYSFYDLEPGKTYTFTVRTRDKAGNLSAHSAPVEINTVKLTVTPVMEASYVVDLVQYHKIPVTYTVTPSVEDYTPVIREAWLEFRPSGSDGGWSTNALRTNGSGDWNIAGEDDDGFLPKGSYDLYFHVIDSLGAEAVSEPVTVVVLTIDTVPPTTPGIPRATSHTTTSINFVWDASEDNVAVRHYEIWRDGVNIGDTLYKQWSDTDLEMGTYAYSVVAVDYRGNRSPASETALLSTMQLEFDAVMDFEDSYVLEEQTLDRIDIWADFKEQEGYTANVQMALEYKAADATEWAHTYLNGSDGTDPSIRHGYWYLTGDVLGYLPVGDYTVRFSVTDGHATAYSAEQTVTLCGETEAPRITAIRPDSGTMSGKDIKLSAYAADNVGIGSLTLSYAAEGSETFTELHRAEGTPSTTYTWDASALPSGNYVIKATATDRRGNVGESTVTITVDNTPPAVPFGVTATGTSRYIHVMWDTAYGHPSDLLYFRVYRGTSASGPFEQVAQSGSFGYFDDGKSITANTNYFYYVTAVDIYGNESACEQILSAKLQPDTESPQIGDMLPRENTGLRKDVTLKVTAADNYRLAKAVFSYRLKGASQWIELGTVPVDGITNNQVFQWFWTIPANIAKGTYELRAQVYDDSINDEALGYAANPPAEMIRTVTISPYSAPKAPAVTATSEYKKANLSWTYVGDTETLTQFTVYRTNATGGDRVYAAAAAKGSTGECTVTIPAVGVQYFVVVATDVYGATAASQVVSITSLPGETESPVAVLQPETLTSAVGVPFNFSAVNSTDNDVIASYVWDFGDGTTGTGVTPSHTYTRAGSYTVKLTVTDACDNSTTVTRTMNVYDLGGANATHALVTLKTVNAYVEGTPAIKGADVKILVEEDGETVFEFSAITGDNGTVTAVVPIGEITVSAIAEGFMSSSRSVTVEPDEAGKFDYIMGLTPMNVSLVDGSLSVEEMTYSEILAAGIDVTDPDNNHVWKFAAELEFVAAPALPFDIPNIPVTGYFNGTGKFIGGAGWGWNHVGGSGGGGGGTGWGMNIGIFPISENFVLVIYGEAHWLKEMYNVELLVINNSYTDDITDCKAALMLPEGLSLAAMTGEAQDLTIDLGTIPHKTAANDGANTAKANWYVRGDKEGEYNLTASVIGRNPDIFVKSFTTDKPVKVYAGSALKLFIKAEDIAYRGEEYHVQFKLQNVSPKSLYNLSFGITGADQFKVLTMGDNDAQLTLTHEDFKDNMTRGVDVLLPGGSITIDFYTTIWFNSLLELAELGPLDVGYYLTNVFVTTLEGSTTTIPYEVEIVRSSHGTFFEWLTEETKDFLEGEVIDLLEKELLDEIPLISTGKKIFEFVSHGPADSRCVINIEGGYVTPSNNFLRRSTFAAPAPTGAVAVYTDAEQYTVSEDGKTLTLLSDGKIYVEGKKAGEATLTVTTTANEGTQENVHTLIFDVTRGSVEAEDLILQAPAVGLEDGKAAIPLAGDTLEITFPYLLKGADGTYMTTAPNAVWAVTGADTDGVTVKNGIVTIKSHAEAGDYTVTLTVGEKTATQTFTLTREASVAQYVEISSGTAVLGDSYLLPLDSAAVDFTAQVFDQYGVVFDTPVTWKSVGSSDVASAVNGKVTPGSITGTVTLTASVSSNAALTDTLTVVVADASQLSVEKLVTDTGCTVTLGNGSDQTVTVQALIAAYDANGKMVACSTDVVTVASGAAADLALTWRAADAVASVQVFLVNAASMAPVTAAK